MTVNDLQNELHGCKPQREVKVRFVRDPAIDTTTLYDIGYVADDEGPVVLEAFSDTVEDS